MAFPTEFSFFNGVSLPEDQLNILHRLFAFHAVVRMAAFIFLWMHISCLPDCDCVCLLLSNLLVRYTQYDFEDHERILTQQGQREVIDYIQNMQAKSDNQNILHRVRVYKAHFYFPSSYTYTPAFSIQ